ncbi:MAG: carboxypeptidase regulatory-like domain-containing protein [Chloroflexi bacterium]|nr:carboxypeptidase regulatory-like domain-containing protein [Chloroflexota bacterium]
MSVTEPIFGTIPRQSVVGMEGMWAKMFDPPTENPETPDWISPTNPVPEVMAQAGYQDTPHTSHTVMRDLLHGAKLSAWDSKEITFFLFRDHDNPATGAGNFPGATIRVPRGVWFHGETQGHGPPPHTIHWHGIEPTPINDGVGHCSMEIGHYTYQWQPNFVGFYFCHCHRNTVQHFEFGLYQALLIDPPDAFWATLVDRSIPIGAGRDGKRRIAANLSNIRGPGGPITPDPASGAGFEGAVISNPFSGFIAGSIEEADPWASDPPGTHDSRLIFPVNPHAMTVPYDVEVLWVVDDRDSKWSDEAPDARATYPRHGGIPGDDDNFHGNAGGGTDSSKFFAFNDFNPDYWYVTGVNFAPPDPVNAPNIGTIPSDIVIPPELISGVSGVQVPINANVGQTILVRLLDGAYNNITARFPVPVTIIAWDGRALGVAPFNAYNHPYQVPANTPIHTSVARRYDALIKVDAPVSGFVEIDFTDTRCGTDTSFERPVRFTGKIPINIGYGISGRVTNSEHGFGLGRVTVTLSGAASKTTVTDDLGYYSFAGLPVGGYTVTPSLDGFDFAPVDAGVTITDASVAVPDFVATAVDGIYSISGLLFESRGGGAIGASPGAQANPVATVTLSGPVSGTATPDSQGRFFFNGLPDGTYVVTPVSAAFTFRPTSRTVVISGANRSMSFRGRPVPMVV